MDHFSRYSRKESHILDIWKANSGLIPHEWNIQKDNTPYHDAKVILPDGTQFLVQVKEEEARWYTRTGNIGLDYISAFSFIDKAYETNCLKTLNHWIPPKEISTFLKKIKVEKYGKLKTCDAHVHVFYVGGKGATGKTELPLLLKTYCNQWLKSEAFIDYLKSKYSLRINNKKAYNIDESWHSAAFFLSPSDDMLRKGEIDTHEKLLKCIGKS
ncbi:hypothetical protein J8C02_12620 [Chloracidobacterium sp. MS 40/45]|uniref:hypothetical protein n=1 Tax=Chloracidobacterium aggregatum TaxID=2851959 RepID=UPI001B8C6546|nr:hypothetical protein [Chloracidobacterium aggregatum]QUW01729.1 hypothetical protein J8C02_12620 [Chloracidobacterium sp. MS 40/45]